MSIETRVTKVKQRIHEETQRVKSNAIVTWGLLFMAAALASIPASTMYGPIIIGAIVMVMFQYLTMISYAKERVGYLGKAYANPMALIYIESGIDGVKDLEESIRKWEAMTDDEREAANKRINVITVVALLALIAAVSGFFCGLFWLLPV
uniref:Transcriptional regulator n=1 Tax=Aeromonas phage vB_AdhaM_G2 TaxID=3238786 RepID=A0AB39TZW5_9CAUD